MTESDRPHDYLPRVVDAEMREVLRAAPAVLIEGPRACGKTWTGRHFAASERYMDAQAQARLAAGLDPAALLNGPTPLLLDEWQIAPDVWNPMRRACDERGLPGQFILTGSADPPDDITRHSGAGRLLRVRMRPMSLFESGESDGSISLAGLFLGERCSAADSGHRLGDIVETACRGGWPDLVRRGAGAATAQRLMRGYLDEISRTDVSRVDGVDRNPSGVRRLLASLARNTAGEASASTLAADTADPAGAAPAVHRRTVASYMAALERLFVVEDVPAWKPHLRSRAQLRGQPKRHLADPSLAVAALEADSDAVMADLRFAGLLFESLAVRDIRVYAQACEAAVSHYRDSDGLEVDVIVTRPGGQWLAAEIKLGGEAAIEHAVRSLRRLRDKIDAARTRPPARLVVLTAGGYGFEHPDGVSVVPVTSLGP
ncbi:ATP-binding protein [Candidatus Poriferisodalis sp.]|uniref:ATP-binding protein n=1 Tax=Candidatus Poriferisodalis sp. TaxID=3101277 RepID=UPI003B01BFA1